MRFAQVLNQDNHCGSTAIASMLLIGTQTPTMADWHIMSMNLPKLKVRALCSTMLVQHQARSHTCPYSAHAAHAGAPVRARVPESGLQAPADGLAFSGQLGDSTFLSTTMFTMQQLRIDPAICY